MISFFYFLIFCSFCILIIAATSDLIVGEQEKFFLNLTTPILFSFKLSCNYKTN